MFKGKNKAKILLYLLNYIVFYYYKMQTRTRCSNMHVEASNTVFATYKSNKIVTLGKQKNHQFPTKYTHKWTSYTGFHLYFRITFG